MRLTLEKVAHIRTGYTFREAFTESEAGDVRVLQIKDLRQGTIIDAKDLPKVVWSGRGEPPALSANEIVVAARGEHNRAAIYMGGDAVVPSNQLLILRVTKANVMPEFLCWLLNHDVVQQKLKAEGTSITAISKANLGALEVRIPALEAQKKIVALQGIWDQEQAVLARLQQNRATMVKAMFRTLLGE